MCAMSTEFIDEDFSAVPSTLLKRMARYRVARADSCINCGLCESLCPYGVHRRVEGHVKMLPPADAKCIGPTCSANSFYCVKNCPTQSLSVVAEPGVRQHGRPALDPGHDHRHLEAGRDRRCRYPWTIHAQTPTQAADSTAYRSQLPPAKGNFDPEDDLYGHRSEPPQVRADGSRSTSRSTEAACPSVHQQADDARQGHRGAQAWNTFTCTGEGGYPGPADPVQGSCHHPDRHRTVRRARGDDQARPDRRVQVRPGREARSGRPPALR